MSVDYKEVDLVYLLQTIWRKRYLIGAIIIAFALASVPICFIVREYRSEGILRLSSEDLRLSVPTYKAYALQINDVDQIIEYLRLREKHYSQVLPGLKRKLSKRDSLTKYVHVIYAYGTEELQKTALNFDPTKQYIKAVCIKWSEASAEVAQKTVAAIGEFIKFSLGKKLLEDYIKEARAENLIKLYQIENNLKNLAFTLEQERRKAKDLENISHRYPQSSERETREIVSVEQGGHLYLPVSTQLVATNVAISETRLKINEFERKRKIGEIKEQFFSELEIPTSKADPENLFGYLKGAKDTFFGRKELSGEEGLIARNDICRDITRYGHWFNDVMVFTLGPTRPQEAYPTPRIILAGSLLVAFFIAPLLVLGIEISSSRGRVKGDEGSETD